MEHDAPTTADQALTSTTAPGETFPSRPALADHYRSDYHRYNLKRKAVGLPCLRRVDFDARLAAAVALRAEKEDRRDGTAHLKGSRGAPSAVPSYGARFAGKKSGRSGKYDRAADKHERKRQEAARREEEEEEDGPVGAATADLGRLSTADAPPAMAAEVAPAIDPRRCLFTLRPYPSAVASLAGMQQEYGFFLPDKEYCVDAEGLLGYCAEKIWLGHMCLFCQRTFGSGDAAVRHMLAVQHTKIRYEEGVDMDEFAPFYDFSTANEATEDGDAAMDDDDDVVWETDEEDADSGSDSDSSDDLAQYQAEIRSRGFGITPLGELIFPDGRIVGHRALSRYYRQNVARPANGTALVAVRGELPAPLPPAVKGLAVRSRGGGVLVARAGGFTAASLYRHRAVVKKARMTDAAGKRKFQRHNLNINKLDKKANRLMTNVSVAWAKR